MEKKLYRIYYSASGYWLGKNAINKLSKRSGINRNDVEKWLLKQPLYQIYLPKPKYIPRPNSSFSVSLKPNKIHQADLLYLTHDRVGRKVYKYALTVVDVASRYKAAYQLTTKSAMEVSKAIEKIYKDTLLTYPETLIVDDGKEFYGEFSKLMKKHNVTIQRSMDKAEHRSTGMVERFNQTLSRRLLAYQYHKEFNADKSNREWQKRLQNVVKAINNEKTSLIKMKPIDAIKLKTVSQGFSSPILEKEKEIPPASTLRYLYQPGELEGVVYKGELRKRATDPIWSVDTYTISKIIKKKKQPTLYYLNGVNRAFVAQELQIVS